MNKSFIENLEEILWTIYYHFLLEKEEDLIKMVAEGIYNFYLMEELTEEA